MFGRGGEELESLLQEKIPFEIVPGVTSAAAVPAYAGDPCDSPGLRFFLPCDHRTREKGRKGGTGFPGACQAGWHPGVPDGAFLHGVPPKRADRGRDGSDMPAAVLENGTSAGQRRVTATVTTLKEASDRAGIKTPAIIVVGKVCALSSRMHWAEDRVLGGRQFLVTRPRQSSSSLASRLRDLGAQVIEMPAIRTEPICPNERLKKALETFGMHAAQEWLVFTSPAGADIFFDQLMELGMDLRSLLVRRAEVRIAAIGSGTAAVLEKRGLIPDLVPQVYSAAALGEALAETAAEGSHVTVARAEKGSEELIPPLLSAGLSVEDVSRCTGRCMRRIPFSGNRSGKCWKAGKLTP